MDDITAREIGDELVRLGAPSSPDREPRPLVVEMLGALREAGLLDDDLGRELEQRMRVVRPAAIVSSDVHDRAEKYLRGLLEQEGPYGLTEGEDHLRRIEVLLRVGALPRSSVARELIGRVLAEHGSARPEAGEGEDEVVRVVAVGAPRDAELTVTVVEQFRRQVRIHWVAAPTRGTSERSGRRRRRLEPRLRLDDDVDTRYRSNMSQTFSDGGAGLYGTSVFRPAPPRHATQLHVANAGVLLAQIRLR